MVKDDAGKDKILTTPAASDAINAYASRMSMTQRVNLKNKEGNHGHYDFAAIPSVVRASLAGPGSFRGAGGKLSKADYDVSDQDIQELADLIGLEGQADKFTTTMNRFNYFLLLLFILLELSFFPNPEDIYKHYSYKNTTVAYENETVNMMLPVEDGNQNFREWLSWSFDAEERGCGYERLWIWSRDHGLYNSNICMNSWAAWGCLAISRSSAVMMYIFFSVVIGTKLRYSLSIIQTSPFEPLLPFHLAQHYHITAGKILLLDAWLHTVFHLIRFVLNAQPAMFWAPVTISGVWGFLVINLICGVWNKSILTCPVRSLLKCFKLDFEHELTLHMLWVTFAVAMWWHRTRFGVYWTVLLGIFIVDRFMERCFLTHMETDMELKAGKSGTLIRFMWYRNSAFVPKVQLAGSIVRVCIPMFSASEYHPFSAFYDSHDARYACLYVHNAGDWTRLLHTYARKHTYMPRAWIAGPVYSEFQACMAHKNITVIASGTAITPVLGLVQYWEPMNHTVTLIWINRDKTLIPLLLPAVNPRTKVIMLYTGKDTYDDVMTVDTPIDEFFEKPKHHNPVQALRAESSDVGGIADLNTSLESGMGAQTENPVIHCEIVPGSLRRWTPEEYEQLIVDNIVTKEQDPLADNVVALSFKSLMLAEKFEGICKKHKIARVRCDASFG